MIGKVFINDVLSQGILLYLKIKDKPLEQSGQNFLVTAIRTLVYIYGELDIVNPYITQNEHNMGGFDSNITKYGYPKDKLEEFKNAFISYKEETLKNIKPNKSFIKIEESLIDMFFYKKKSMNLSLESEIEFKKYLYTSDTKNPYMLKELNLYLNDITLIDKYFNSKKFEMSHTFKLEPIKRNILNEEAYVLLGYKKEQIINLSDYDLEKVNKEIYHFFHVDDTLENKNEVLDKAINYYKRYGNKITSGNGYVDFLLFLSVLATSIFIVILFAFKYL